LTDLLTNLAAILAPVFLISAIGFAWVKSGAGFDQVFVTNIIATLSAPSLVFSTLARMPVAGRDFATMASATFLCVVLFFVLGAAALRLCRLPIKVFLAPLAFPNIGNMGLPVCLFAFGTKGLALATVYFTVVTTLQFSLGPVLASGRFSFGPLLRAPVVYASLAALAVVALHLRVPPWLLNTTGLLGQISVPLMLMALGVALAQLRVHSLHRALVVSILRIGIGAIAGWAVGALFGFHGAFRGVLIIQSAMPAAVFNYLFARLYDNSPEEVAGVIMVSTLLSYLTLPFLVAAVI
jgi:predicted permease